MLVYTAGISHHTAHVYIHFLVSFIAERVQHETEDLQEVLQGERERGRGGRDRESGDMYYYNGRTECSCLCMKCKSYSQYTTQ